MNQTDNPAELRQIFGKNLKTLSMSAPSIAQLCRDIDINRTQFNRYLNGEAFPRPEVLQRICKHFDVDARILLEPLEDLREQSQFPRSFSSVANEMGRGEMFKTDQDRLPTGAYLFYRRAALDPSRVTRTLLMVKPGKFGETRLHSIVPRKVAQRFGLPTHVRERRVSGLFFQHLNSITAMVPFPRQKALHFAYFEYAYLGNPNFLYGFSVVTQRRLPNASVLQPALLERIDPGMKSLQTARRKVGVCSWHELGGLPRRFFERSGGSMPYHI